MPRQPRYFVPGIPQHVIQRGVNRQTVFFERSDYDLYLSALSEAVTRYDCAIHAYVLMTNHVHLLLTPGSQKSLPLLMQAMGRSYVQALNRIHGRSGTLWEGRYKASLVQDDRYLLTCYRYIELNPVRAGLASAPHHYPHSSFARNAYGRANDLINPHSIYMSLGHTTEDRCTAYRKLFEGGLSSVALSEIRDAAKACLVLGDDAFKDRIELMLGRSVRPRKRGRPRSNRGCDDGMIS